jgi:hypothetical protein
MPENVEGAVRGATEPPRNVTREEYLREVRGRVAARPDTGSPRQDTAILATASVPVAGVAPVAPPEAQPSALPDDLDRFVRSRLDLSPAQQTAVCLWIGHTYIYEYFQNTPKLFVTAIMHGVGKTQLLWTVAALSHNGIKRQGSTTESAISRMYSAYGSLTLCLDQLDGMTQQDKKLINLLCDGFEVGATKEMSVLRAENYQPKTFIIGFPQALGMVGDLPDPALASRCITIQMQPADPERQTELFEAQSIPLFDKKTSKPLQIALEWRERFQNELAPQGEKLSKRRWPAPCPSQPRYIEIWQPLFAVAEHFGGEWPERARQAFCELVEAGEVKEKAEVEFLRYVLSRLPPGVVLLTPTELRTRIGPTFRRKPLSLDQQGKWLNKVGVSILLPEECGTIRGTTHHGQPAKSEKWGCEGRHCAYNRRPRAGQGLPQPQRGGPAARGGEEGAARRPRPPPPAHDVSARVASL